MQTWRSWARCLAQIVCVIVLLCGFLAALATVAAVSADRVVLSHPGYTITVWRTGAVRVDFVLNQKGVRHEEIQSGFASYPTDKVRQTRVSTAMTEPLFRLLESREFAAVGSTYLAPKGTFASAGHAVVMTLTASTRGSIGRTVTFDSSRKPDWPDPLRRAVDQVFHLAEATGPLPVGPYIR